MIRIAPSILAADPLRLGDQVREATEAGADRIHVDVMDGHFVPNLAIGPHIVQSLHDVSAPPLEVHLMIANPNRFIPIFADAGAHTLIVHVEGNPHVHRSIALIRSAGCHAGIAINPATSPTAIEEILPAVDLVLVMTVDPGFAGQKFIKSALPKIRKIRASIESQRVQCDIEVDGGINPDTAPMAVTAGANILVAGSAIFRCDTSVTDSLRQLAEAAEGRNPRSLAFCK